MVRRFHAKWSERVFQNEAIVPMNVVEPDGATSAGSGSGSRGRSIAATAGRGEPRASPSQRSRGLLGTPVHFGPVVDPPSRIGVVAILRVREIRVIVLITFVIMLGFGILSPILPQYARSFGVGYDQVGLLIGAFGFTRLLFDLVSGPLVDRHGERAMATVGAAAVGVSSALAAMAPNFTLLVVFRGAGGAGSAVFFAAVMSYVLRSTPRDRMGRVMGVFYSAFNLGIILGQPLGGLAASVFGLASPLWLYSGACFLSAALYLRYIRNPPREPRAEAGPEACGACPGPGRSSPCSW
jgi:Major Facilitator Superfamily